MNHLAKICFFLLLTSTLTAQVQLDDLDWVVGLAEEIVDETDLCETCTWVNPTLSFVRLNTSEFIFLRYSCSTQESFARSYNLDGTINSECLSINGQSDCDFGGNAFTVYTFADTIIDLWSCTKGFDCEFALLNNIDRKVPITIDDARCAEGIKVLKTSDEFQSYNWSGNGVTGDESSLEINQGGDYFITVTDDMDCEFDGTINIPDIAKLDVKIKGPDQFCLGTATELKTTNFQSYEWSNGDTDSLITTMEAGRYEVTVTNDQDCEGTAAFILESFEPLTIEINADAEKVQEGTPVNISVNNNSPNRTITAYEWTSNSEISCEDCSEIIYIPKMENGLILNVIDDNGCRSSAKFSIQVEVLPLEVFAPNIFNPNSPIGNDHFTIYGGTNIQLIERLDVFDRWGMLVYSQQNFMPNQLSTGWDGNIKGEPAQQDVYLYQAVVQFLNGEQKTIAGDVLLVR